MLNQLKKVWGYIRSGLMFIGKVQSAILLTIFYLLILGPVAVVVQLVNRKKREGHKRSYWQLRKIIDNEEALLRQF